MGATCAAGFTQQMTATGTYTDSSTQNLTSSVTWSSSSPTAATVNASGLASCLVVGTPSMLAAAAGNVTVTAQLNSVSGTKVIQVIL